MKFHSISHRISFWLLIISLFPLLIMSEIFLSEFKLQIKEIEIRHLSQMSDKKIEKINAYVNERIADIETLAKNPLIYNAIIEFDKVFYDRGQNKRKYQQVDNAIRSHSTSYLGLGYYDLFLIAPDGDIVFSVLHESDFSTNLFTGKYKHSGLANVTRDAFSVLETGVSDYDYYEPSNELAAFLATPIIENGELLGVLALQINISLVFDVVSNNVGLGKTGETVIGRKVNDTISFIDPLKFSDETELWLDASKGSKLSMPMKKALDGETGNGFSVDSHGENVIAVWRYLPVFHWGVVVKKDVNEVFSIVDKMSQLRWFVFVFLLMTILIFSYFIGYSIVLPIRNLTRVSEEIALGDYHQHVKVDSVDEVGRLATTFNLMTTKLQETHFGLLRQVNKAEKASLAKSEFLSRMSHELRTPMNAILGFGQILELDKDGFNATQNSNVKEILFAGEHLLELINDVLDMAKIESGKLEVSMENVHLNDVMKQCLSLIATQAKTLNLTVTDNVSNKESVVRADFTRLKQVLINILSNAVKYNRKNGFVTVDSEMIGQHRIRINVTDSGNGLTKKEIDRLFIPFERLDKVNNVEGAGIGLVITKHLVDLMGGSIGVECKTGEGCTFWVEFEVIEI